MINDELKIHAVQEVLRELLEPTAAHRTPITGLDPVEIVDNTRQSLRVAAQSHEYPFLCDGNVGMLYVGMARERDSGIYYNGPSPNISLKSTYAGIYLKQNFRDRADNSIPHLISAVELYPTTILSAKHTQFPGTLEEQLNQSLAEFRKSLREPSQYVVFD